MRISIAALVAAVFVAGCHPNGGNDGAAVAPTSAPENIAVGDEPVANEERVSVPNQTPDGAVQVAGVVVKPDFAFTQRYDRIGQTTQTKRDQRQILLEAEVASPDEALLKITAALEQAGFSGGDQKLEYGGQRVKFEMDGKRSVYVLVRDGTSGPKIQNSNAKASVYLTQMQ